MHTNRVETAEGDIGHALLLFSNIALLLFSNIERLGTDAFRGIGSGNRLANATDA